MVNPQFDIFISYKRKSLTSANLLYYMLTIRGYSAFFDIKEMRSGDFDKQIYSYIDNAKDVLIVLEEGSLDSCKTDEWKTDWFCQEIKHALDKDKNIIPILLNDYNMPDGAFFPEELKRLHVKQAERFLLNGVDDVIDRMVKKNYFISEPNNQSKTTSVFKFYSNENCQIFKEGELVCVLEGNSDKPYYLPVARKGDYSFKIVNLKTNKKQTIDKHIDADEEKKVKVLWPVRGGAYSDEHLQESTQQNKNDESTPKANEILESSQLDGPMEPSPNSNNGNCLDEGEPDTNNSSANNGIPAGDNKPIVSGPDHMVKIGLRKIKMIRVDGGYLNKIHSEGQKETPFSANTSSVVAIPTFYIGQFPITQNIWHAIMGYNRSTHKDNFLTRHHRKKNYVRIIGRVKDARNVEKDGKKDSIVSVWKEKRIIDGDDYGCLPAESLTHDEAIDFVTRLSEKTGLNFALPTEDEWEFAAMGGNESNHTNYAGSDSVDEVAWYKENSDENTHPVGRKKPNELGIFDMNGNVWEWTETPATSDNAKKSTEKRYIRKGGCWFDDPSECSISSRRDSSHTKASHYIGLRVVIRGDFEI